VDRRRETFTVANAITVGRLCLVPVFVLLVRAGNRQAAFIVFIIMAMGDAADGIIARLRHEESYLGAVLDPAADKLLLLSSYLVLSASRITFGPGVPEWLMLLVIGRDIYIVTGAASIKLLTNTLRVTPSFLGKTSTFAQMSTVILVLSGFAQAETLQVAFIITGFLTLASGIEYTLIGAAQLRTNAPDIAAAEMKRKRNH